MRAGGEFFTKPGDPAQRRYEALRAYEVDGASAEDAGRRFGYSKATMYQMASDLRAGRISFFASSKPGPKGPRKILTLRERVLELRALDRSVKEIADALGAEGTPISHQSVWVILSSEGLSRLPPRARRVHGPAPPTEAVRAGPLEVWPAGMSIDCAHAGLFVAFPAMVELGVDQVIAAGGYPSTSVLSAWHSMASLLTLKLLRVGRVRHATSLAADEALGLAVGLNVLPKTTHASTYSHRVRREMNTACLASLVAHLRPLGLATGDGGFNLDFHSIRHYGEDGPLDDNYVPARSQSTRSVLAFFAQDHVSTDMVYANADVTKRQASREILAFADHWKATVGVDALTSGLALNVDVDTTLTVIAGSIYRLLARSLKRYEHATPETIHEQFIDTTGHIDVEEEAVIVTLKRRTWTPVLLQAGFAELDLPIPWWGGRHLRFRFP